MRNSHYIVLLLVTQTVAVLQWNDASSQLAFALSSTVTGGTNVDLYLHMSAPQRAGWAAVGIGRGMAGALMFVMYPADNGGEYYKLSHISFSTTNNYCSCDC